MRYWQKIIVWTLLGAAFGTITGILARRLDYWSLTGGILGGMVAAPSLVLVLLVFNYWDKLLLWAAGGAVIGAISLTIIATLATRALSPIRPAEELELTAAAVLDRALIGALVTTWLASGGAVFKRGTTGAIGLLGSGILGAPLGALVRILGNAVDSPALVIQLLGRPNSWSLGETLLGIPVGILAGILTTQYFFHVDLRVDARKPAQ